MISDAIVVLAFVGIAWLLVRDQRQHVRILTVLHAELAALRKRLDGGAP